MRCHSSIGPNSQETYLASVANRLQGPMNSRSLNTKRTWLGWVHDFLARTGLAQHDPEASLTAQQLACIFLGVAVTSCLAACVAYKQLEVQLELAKLQRPGSHSLAASPKVAPAAVHFDRHIGPSWHTALHVPLASCPSITEPPSSLVLWIPSVPSQLVVTLYCWEKWSRGSLPQMVSWPFDQLGHPASFSQDGYTCMGAAHLLVSSSCRDQKGGHQALLLRQSLCLLKLQHHLSS